MCTEHMFTHMHRYRLWQTSLVPPQLSQPSFAKEAFRERLSTPERPLQEVCPDDSRPLKNSFSFSYRDSLYAYDSYE